MLELWSRRADLRSYLSGGIRRPQLRALLRAAFLAALGLICAWLVYFSIVAIAFPYPLEYREGAPLVMTSFLLEGQNPFVLDNQPLGMNIYGIAFGLVTLPLAALFGNTLLVHRAVSVVCILLCSVLVFRATNKVAKDAALSIAGGALVYMVIGALGGLGAFPGAMGTLLFVAAILVPFDRAFDSRGLMVSAVLSLLAFYTKPYFLLSFGIVASYALLFVSRRAAVLLVSAFAVMFVAAFLLVRTLFPFYFFDVLLSNYFITSADSAYAFDQLLELVTEFSPMIVGAVLLLWAPGVPPEPAPAPIASVPSKRDGALSDRPLLGRSCDYWGYALACSLLAFVLFLAPHQGAYMTYGYQLVLPPFFLWWFRRSTSRHRMALLVLPLLIANLTTFCLKRYDPAFLQTLRSSTLEWEKLYRIVGRSRHILNSPVVVPEMLRLGMRPVDSGLSESFYWGGEYPDIALLAPGQDVVEARRAAYLESIRASIVNQEYDRIIATGRVGFFFDRELVPRFYIRTATVPIEMPLTRERWNLIVWEPRLPTIQE